MGSDEDMAVGFQPVLSSNGQRTAEPSGPVRVQLSRAKGARMPPHTKKVDRTTRHGNPYLVEECGAYDAVQAFRRYMTDPLWEDPYVRADQVRRRQALADLRGWNLACWCRPGSPCHADVLLELANRELEGDAS